MKSTCHNHYIPAVDGLRALAVIAVILCHARFAIFSGGYVGVDLFFVISGYVVALSIQRNLAMNRFSFAKFFTGRLKRLTPALYCVMAAAFMFSLVFRFPEDSLATLKNIGAVALFYSNIYLSKKTGYFDLEAGKQPLLHTWSLSVEEQFYLLAPLLLVLLYRRALWIRIAILCFMGGASLYYSQYALNHSLPGAYFTLQTRAFEFLAGIILAQIPVSRDREKSGILSEALLVAGLGVIGWTVFTYRPDTAMPGVNALWPCVGAVLVLAGISGSRHGVRLLANPLAVYVGKISYALYLWHWVVLFAFWRLGLAGPVWIIIALAVTLAFSIPTYHFVEQRLRWVDWGTGKTVMLLFVLPVAIIASLIAVGKRTQDFSVFYPEAYRKDYLESGLTPFKEPRARTCWSKVGVTSAKDCTVGDADSADKAVLWGDSHAYHLIHFVDQLGKQRGLAIHDMTFTMCAPIENSPPQAGNPGFRQHADECHKHDLAVMQHILSHPEIKTVFMSAVWALYAHAGDTPSHHGFLPGQIDRELADTVGKLTAAGKRVVLFNDIPTLPDEVTDCVANKLYLPNRSGERCTYSQTLALKDGEIAAGILGRISARFDSVGVIHTYDVPCSNGICHAALDGTSLYAHNDPSHLGLGGSKVYFAEYRKKHPGELDAIFSHRAELTSTVNAPAGALHN